MRTGRRASHHIFLPRIRQYDIMVPGKVTASFTEKFPNAAAREQAGRLFFAGLSGLLSLKGKPLQATGRISKFKARDAPSATAIFCFP